MTVKQKMPLFGFDQDGIFVAPLGLPSDVYSFGAGLIILRLSSQKDT